MPEGLEEGSGVVTLGGALCLQTAVFAKPLPHTKPAIVQTATQVLPWKLNTSWCIISAGFFCRRGSLEVLVGGVFSDLMESALANSLNHAPCSDRASSGARSLQGR
jgi:hypothetical protein